MPISKLYKNGNSIVIAIPRHILEQIHLKAGQKMRVCLAACDDYGPEKLILLTPERTNENKRAPFDI